MDYYIHQNLADQVKEQVITAVSINKTVTKQYIYNALLQLPPTTIYYYQKEPKKALLRSLQAANFSAILWMSRSPNSDW